MDLFNILMLLFSSTEDTESQRLILQRVDLLSALVKLESQTEHMDELLKNRPADIRIAAIDVENLFNELIKSRPDNSEETAGNLPERKQALVELIDQLLTMTYSYFSQSDIESALIMSLPSPSTLGDLYPLI